MVTDLLLIGMNKAKNVEDPFVAARILDRFACIALSSIAYSMYTKVVEPVYVAWEDIKTTVNQPFYAS